MTEHPLIYPFKLKRRSCPLCADEIAQLRAEVRHLQSVRDALAEALRLYADDDNNYDWGEPMREIATGDPDWLVDRVHDLGHTARTALALLVVESGEKG